MLKRFLAILLGILLLLAGFRGFIVAAVGETTTGVITGHKQVVGKNSKKIDHNYNVNYRFVDSEGTERSGAYMQMRVYDVSRLPASGTSIEIRYFKPYSGLSVPASKIFPSLYDLLVAGAGLLMIVGGGSASIRKRGKKATGTVPIAMTAQPVPPPGQYPQQPGYPPPSQYPQQPGYPPQGQYPQNPNPPPPAT